MTNDKQQQQKPSVHGTADVQSDNPRQLLRRAATPPCPYHVVLLSNDFVIYPYTLTRFIDYLDNPVRVPGVITAALAGAGSYKKTMLAKAICHNQQACAAFWCAVWSWAG